MVYARVNTIFGRRDTIAAGVARVEGTDRAAVEASRGNRGLTTLMDGDAGVIVALSYWMDPLHSSAPNLTRVRERIAAAARGALVAETYAVAWQEPGPAPAWPGAAVRIDRLQTDPVAEVAGHDLLRAHVRQEAGGDSGFCGAEVMVDRGNGAALLITTWTAGAAQRADAVVAQLCDGAAGAGITLRRTETYVLVRGCAPIRAPR
ncbi:hypothetical protein ACQEVB_24500 [Pseudonocardia sp. CA-107938]|uniref:hypothetical protein n=1 Tax=Pseudonocardia sp. CA-107938 TaxID=3240021 RepID=UPI003D915714